MVRNIPYSLLYQYIESINRNCFFVLPRLIQSQPQFGAPSAKALDHESDVFTGVLSKDLLNFVSRGIGNC
jgi:hypothetical protein